MKKAITFLSLVCIFIMLSLSLYGCGSKYIDKNCYYVGTWGSTDDNRVIFLDTNGNFEYTTSIGTETGTYRFSDNTLIMAGTDGVVFQYETLDRKYILYQEYEGNAPKDETFTALFTQDSGNSGEKIQFSSNSTVTYEIYITDLSRNLIPGSYTREGDILHCNFTLYGKKDFIIVDEKLYSFFELQENYTPTATPTPTSEVTATPKPTAAATPTTAPVTAEDVETSTVAPSTEEGTETSAD